MRQQSDKERLQELAQFLRTRRARISPIQAGFPDSGKRRIPGLRRAEVALLAGISVDWYTWLEQARHIQVSAQVLEAIARALQLDFHERRHLFLLALQQFPADQPLAGSAISPTLQSFLDQQGASPAYVTDERLNIVAWNRCASFIYGNYEDMSARERNSVWRTFTSPYVRELLRDNWENHARHRLAQFRASYANFTGHPWWLDFIGELSRTSAEFQMWWQQHDVLSGPEGLKIIYHPTLGRLTFNQLSFVVTDAPQLTVTINVPANIDETAEKLRSFQS
ncbi:helix-turn-helix transcriptional regulator [Brevibacillus migulae]|uniref:helix-turn-helix transcriptional regulator n=1 Tax=Brevibacillus migulae TaxID=1644114 RepID=UPI00106E44E4|nr:helix-turn-helix transcriptional regulator [Brevibacillus migulae]